MRVKTEARRMALIQAAGKLFVDHGFAAVSMEAIAAEAGSSKVTLYNYFASKEALFEAFVVEAGRGGVEQLGDLPPARQEVRTTLLALGSGYLRLVTRPPVVALHRLIIGEAKRQPELTRIFFENGLQRTVEALMAVIVECMKRGQVVPGDARVVALHFKGLCDADIVEHQLWALGPDPSHRQIAMAAERAVEAFLHGYAPRAATRTPKRS